jgi:hypothetical protein
MGTTLRGFSVTQLGANVNGMSNGKRVSAEELCFELVPSPVVPANPTAGPAVARNRSWLMPSSSPLVNVMSEPSVVRSPRQ